MKLRVQVIEICAVVMPPVYVLPYFWTQICRVWLISARRSESWLSTGIVYL